MIRPPKGNALRAIVFRFFRWPFAVGWAPHSSEPAWEISLHLGPRSPSARDVRKVLRIVPDLEPELLEDVRMLVGGLAAGRERLGRHAPMSVRVVVSLTHVRMELDGLAREVAEGHVRLPELSRRWTIEPDGVLETER